MKSDTRPSKLVVKEPGMQKDQLYKVCNRKGLSESAKDSSCVEKADTWILTTAAACYRSSCIRKGIDFGLIRTKTSSIQLHRCTVIHLWIAFWLTVIHTCLAQFYFLYQQSLWQVIINFTIDVALSHLISVTLWIMLLHTPLIKAISLLTPVQHVFACRIIPDHCWLCRWFHPQTTCMT